jgi:hypothetical protein
LLALSHQQRTLPGYRPSRASGGATARGATGASARHARGDAGPRGGERPRERSALRGFARNPNRWALSAIGPEPAAQEGEDIPSAPRSGGGLGIAPTCASALRGRTLDRPNHARAAGPGCRSGTAPAGAGRDYFPARVRPAVDRARARHHALAEPAGAAARRCRRRAGDRGQAASR